MQTPQTAEAKSAETKTGAPGSRLHGRRKGKKLRSHQAELIDTLLPVLTLDVTQKIADAAALFATQPAEIWLEIGFGGGEHLIGEAETHPQAGFIGCEPFQNGLAKALALAEAKALGNLRLYCGDARDVIAALPDRALAGVYLLYPDPWPNAGIASAGFFQTRCSRPSPACCSPAPRSALPPISTTMPAGRWRVCCTRPISPGRPQRLRIGASPGRIGPARAMKQRRSPRDAHPPI